MRALGLDLGSKRIGVAISDSAGTMAVPSDTVHRCGDRALDHRRIAELAEEADAEVVVVGLPLSMDGTDGPAARRTQAEVRALRRCLRQPVETYDERLTTVSAQRSLREAGVGGRHRREVVDRTAAAVILQGWLDHRRTAATSSPSSDLPVSGEADPEAERP